MSNVRPLLIDKIIKQKKKVIEDKDKVAKPKVPKEPVYIRAYPHSAQLSNWGKIETVLDLFQSYSKLAKSIRDHQLYLFFTIGKLDRDATLPVTNDKGSLLSLRYQQTCQYQVVGMLNSWIALRQDDFKRLVMQSSIDQEMKKELLSINFHKAWFKPSTLYSPDAVRFAQNIMRHLFKANNIPDVKNINLALDEKVAKLEIANKTSQFPYWLKLSTLESGKPIYLPVQSNRQFENVGGKRKPFVQLNLSADKGLSVALIKEFKQKEYTSRTPMVAMDSGLCVLYATDQGDLLGIGVFDKLKYLDGLIVKCAAGRQKRGLRVRCDRYDKLVNRVRGLLETEIGRIFNTLVRRLAPAEIVMESLDFKDANLSRRLNRIIRNFGRGIVKEKLTALNEEYGIIVTQVPAAYTSQECPNCHHVEKGNRKTRDNFECKECGFKRHADVVGARNIGLRRSYPEVKLGVASYIRREVVLSRLVSKHHRWCFQQSMIRKQCSRKQLCESG